MVDDTVIYELKNKRDTLDFEIKKLECQLLNVENKLKHITFDILGFLAMIILPHLLVVALDYLRTKSLILIIFGNIAYVVAGCIYIVSLPFTIYGLIKNILLKVSNRENQDCLWQKPDIRRYSSQTAQEEASYISEKRKIIWVLNKYYLYQETCQQLLRQAQNEEKTVTRKEIEAAFEAMPLYEEIKPTNPFNGKMVKQARGFTWIIFLGIVGILLLIAFG
ncbi:MAG: hypothetical protein NC081_08740 [Roseburia sp.]|nr:hypothetical protein [Roseburia sp.]